MLSDIVDRHIAMHRATGYLYQQQGKLLRSFARYAESRGEEFVVATTALEWAGSVSALSTRQVRLGVVRRFAWLMRAEDPRHEVPPSGAFGSRAPRRTPYIYTPEEIGSLLNAASKLGPRSSLRPKVYSTLFGLIAATGMRISEALRLRLADVTDEGLVIQKTKFNKSRLVPLHNSTRRVLDVYIKDRAKFACDDDALFVSTNGVALQYWTANATFLKLARGIGLHPGPGQRGPRVHDLRHTFAVRALEQCEGNGEAVSRHMLALSTYLGHGKIAATYWYMQATPALLSDIARRSEALAVGGAR